MAIHYQNCIWNVINISLYISLFRSLVNLILDPLSPRLSVRPKHNPTLALPLLHTPQNWKEISTLRQVCLHAHAHAHTLTHSRAGKTEMCKVPADLQALQLSSGQIPGSHGPGPAKAFTVPALTFMQHSLILPSAVYSGDQEIHQLTVE